MDNALDGFLAMALLGLLVTLWGVVSVLVGWLGMKWTTRGGLVAALGFVLLALAGLGNPIINLPVGFLARESMAEDMKAIDDVSLHDFEERFGTVKEVRDGAVEGTSQHRYEIGPWYALWPAVIVADADNDGSVRSVWLD